jgi:hypothetical protein
MRSHPFLYRSATVRLLTLLGPALTAALAISCSSGTGVSESQRVSDDLQALAVTFASGDSSAAVTKDLTLPTRGSVAGSTVTWTSSAPVTVSSSGKVVQPQAGTSPVTVTLTASVAFGGAQQDKTFNLTVQPSTVVNFVFTSDSHFGDYTKAGVTFQGATSVDSVTVNSRMRDAINTLPNLTAPDDYGVLAGQPFGTFDFMVNLGDQTSKGETGTDTATNTALRWDEWKSVYSDGLTLTNRAGAALPIYLTPGNHDVANALGGPDIVPIAHDATALVNIYNWTMKPATPLTLATFDYNQHKVFKVEKIGGINCVFTNQWMDAEMIENLTAYLAAHAEATTAPMFIFCHMPPEQTGANFRDPSSDGITFPWTYGFNNIFRDPMSPDDGDNTLTTTAPLKEVTALATFLKAHKNIVAWFHGHDNFTQFRTWNGENSVSIDNTMTQLAIPVFRVDSPMKGKDSAKAPAKMAFNVVSIDTVTKQLTIRECLWNATNTQGGGVGWGISETVPTTNRVR